MSQQGWGPPPQGGWPQHPVPAPRPPRRGRTGIIALVTVLVGLLCAVGVVFVVFRDSFDEIAQLLEPMGDSGPGGTMDLGNQVTVTVPDGWDVKQPKAVQYEPASASRGLSTVSGNTYRKMRQSPADLCNDYLRSMARVGIANAVYTDATVIKSSGDTVAVLCEVTGTATGGFGSGPTGRRCVVARAEPGLTAQLTLRYRPGSTKEETLQDFGTMADSMWETLID
ncbi:hypothetical protein [Microlunatus sp. GCM10028923]|uniref:hypothetical protein n=1 Tax=Microlunatus sp. GCM10028923 TaxID=3273400 RepID=UPI003616CF8F